MERVKTAPAWVVTRQHNLHSYLEVSKVLKPWVHLLRNEGDKTLLKKTACIVLNSKVFFIMSLAFVALLSVPMFQKGNIIDATNNIISFSASISCFGGFSFFFKERASIAQALSQIMVVAEDITMASDNKSQDSVKKATSFAGKIFVGARWYGAFLVITVILPPCIRGQLEWEMPWLYLDERFGVVTAIAYQTAVLIPLGACWQGFFSLCLGVNLCCAALFKAIRCSLCNSSGRGVRSERAVRDLVAMHTILSGATKTVNDLFAIYQLPFLVGILMVPGLTTYTVIKDTPHYFSLSALPAILLIFLPLCLVGQHLEDESTRVGTDAFNAPWIESTANTRKLYLNVMSTASRPQTVRMKGICSLNCIAFQGTLRSWFSYLNLLLNADSRTLR